MKTSAKRETKSRCDLALGILRVFLLGGICYGAGLVSTRYLGCLNAHAWNGAQAPQRYVAAAIRGQLAEVTSAAAIIWILRRKAPARKSTFDSRKPACNHLWSAFLGAISGLVMIIVLTPYMSFVRDIVGPRTHDMLPVLMTGSHSQRLVATFTLCLLGPLTEEVMFRGLIFRLLRNQGFVRPGIIVSSVLFAASHIGVSDALMAFPVGVALAWLYDQTGRLSAPLAAHVLINSIAVFRFLC